MSVDKKKCRLSGVRDREDGADQQLSKSICNHFTNKGVEKSMKKSKAFELAIVAVVSSNLDGEDMIEVLDALCEERRTAKIIERREAEHAAAS